MIVPEVSHARFLPTSRKILLFKPYSQGIWKVTEEFAMVTEISTDGEGNYTVTTEVGGEVLEIDRVTGSIKKVFPEL